MGLPSTLWGSTPNTSGSGGKLQHILFQLCTINIASCPVQICLPIFINKNIGVNSMNIFDGCWFYLVRPAGLSAMATPMAKPLP